MEKRVLIKILNYCVLVLLIAFAGGCEEDDPVAEGTLFEMINAYRVSKGLAEIPYSASLTTVSELHVQDLADNQPVKGQCNLHSWSGKGSWSACCYTDDHAAKQCMWNKPRELTSYKGTGYEIAAWRSNGITAVRALEMWKESEGHNDVILNRGKWADVEFKALGVAIYKGYAVAWFGPEPDQ